MDKQIYQRMREVENEHWWFVGRRRIVESVIRSIDLPEDAQILDAGCGTGGNLAMLGRFGQVKGMELDDDAREYANSLGLTQIRAGRLPDEMPYAGENFDLIVLLDVLEHIDEDSASLKILKSRLNNGGHIIITVPAFQWLWGPHDEAHHHKRRYTADQLKQTIKAAELYVEYISYFNTWLFPLIAPVRLMQSNKSTTSTELGLPPKPVNKILSHLFASERRVVPSTRLPFGVSLIAVLKSPTKQV